ncbi:MAG: flagellar motor protein MotB [Rhodospirillales bacterium]|nr:flagellar motor protein MotB [Rhodospirillales bacterium]
MAKPGGGTIIIKKIKKRGHGGHHGGAWKVAYADFVTAMMAFFLLLWLINVTTDVQKKGIADYFAPTVATISVTSGAGGMLGGQVIGKPGAMTVSAAAPALADPVTSMRQPDEGDEGERSGNPGQRLEITDEALETSIAQREEQQFALAEFQLKKAMENVPELRELADNLLVDRTPEGLRIQLVDQDKRSMFPRASAEMYEPAKKLMGVVAQIVARLPNKITVTGHTDATPYSKGSGYGNWELSTDRANASRRELLNAGLDESRIAKVVGMADREPLVPEDPTSPQNRRISIVLMREAPIEPPAPRAAEKSATAPPQKAEAVPPALEPPRKLARQ